MNRLSFVLRSHVDQRTKMAFLEEDADTGVWLERVVSRLNADLFNVRSIDLI